MTEKSIFNQPGSLLYKCRRCGREFSDAHVPDIFTTLVKLNHEGNHYIPYVFIKEKVIHLCRDESGIGIADIIGGKFDA